MMDRTATDLRSRARDRESPPWRLSRPEAHFRVRRPDRCGACRDVGATERERLGYRLFEVCRRVPLPHETDAGTGAVGKGGAVLRKALEYHLHGGGEAGEVAFVDSERHVRVHVFAAAEAVEADDDTPRGHRLQWGEPEPFELAEAQED